MAGCNVLTNVAITTISSVCTDLIEMDISGISAVTDQSLIYLTIGCHKLQVLNASGTQISGLTIDFLSQHSKYLTNLILDDCRKITVESLVNLHGLKNFTGLSIKQNPNINHFGLILLVSRLAGLKSLDISDCPLLSDTSVFKIKSTHPKLLLTYHFACK